MTTTFAFTAEAIHASTGPNSSSSALVRVPIVPEPRAPVGEAGKAWWPRQRSARAARSEAAPVYLPTAVAEMHAAQLSCALGRAPVSGNRVEILIDGPQTHEAMFAAIEQARDHINIESYTLDHSGPGARLAQLLLAKRAMGVQVNIIFDSFGSLQTSAAYFRMLRNAGVALCEYNPVNPWRASVNRALRLHLRNHRKLLIVDGRVAFVGGVNISSVYSAPSGPMKFFLRRALRRIPWRDTHVRIEGPVVESLQQLFLEHWRCHSHGSPAPARYRRALPHVGAQRVAVAACEAGRRRNPFYRALLGAIDHAQRSVYITTAYFVPPRRVIRALEAAARRGVDVRLMLPSVTDAWVALAAGRAQYGRLLEAGVKIYERQDAVLHAKTTIVDGVWATVGSSNMDWRSFLHNAEVNVIVLDQTFVAQLEEVMLQDIAKSRRMELARWAARGWFARLEERLARRVEFFL